MQENGAWPFREMDKTISPQLVIKGRPAQGALGRWNRKVSEALHTVFARIQTHCKKLP